MPREAVVTALGPSADHFRLTASAAGVVAADDLHPRHRWNTFTATSGRLGGSFPSATKRNANAGEGILDSFRSGTLCREPAGVLLSVEGGYRLGRFRRKCSEQEKEAPVGAMVGATLGLFALLLAFTFGFAAARFDARRQVLLDEANAIGTTYLRAELLSDPIARLSDSYSANTLTFAWKAFALERSSKPSAVGRDPQTSSGRRRRPWARRTPARSSSAFLSSR